MWVTDSTGWYCVSPGCLRDCFTFPTLWGCNQKSKWLGFTSTYTYQCDMMLSPFCYSYCVSLHTVALFSSLTDEKTYVCIIADNERPKLAAALEVSALTYCWLWLQMEGSLLLLYGWLYLLTPGVTRQHVSWTLGNESGLMLLCVDKVSHPWRQTASTVNGAQLGIIMHTSVYTYMCTCAITVVKNCYQSQNVRIFAPTASALHCQSTFNVAQPLQFDGLFVCYCAFAYN